MELTPKRLISLIFNAPLLLSLIPIEQNLEDVEKISSPELYSETTIPLSQIKKMQDSLHISMKPATPKQRLTACYIAECNKDLAAEKIDTPPSRLQRIIETKQSLPSYIEDSEDPFPDLIFLEDEMENDILDLGMSSPEEEPSKSAPSQMADTSEQKKEHSNPLANKENLPSSSSSSLSYFFSDWFKKTDEDTCPPKGARKDYKTNNFLLTPKLLTLSHNQGWGHKINTLWGYSTFAVLFAPDYRLGHFLPMVDLRGHRFDNNTFAANLGVATRYIPECDTFCELLGVNLFYDYRHGHQGNFNQIGLGLEVLGKNWDFRANGYVPLYRLIRHETRVWDCFEGGFVAKRKKYEYTSYGYNLEIGYYLLQRKDFFLYAAAGPYYLARRSFQNTTGGEIRLRPQYKNYLALDLKYSYDPAFKSVFQATVILYLPLYQIARQNTAPCRITDRQVYQPIERFEIMPLGKRCCWRANW